MLAVAPTVSASAKPPIVKPFVVDCEIQPDDQTSVPKWSFHQMVNVFSNRPQAIGLKPANVLIVSFADDRQPVFYEGYPIEDLDQTDPSLILRYMQSDGTVASLSRAQPGNVSEIVYAASGMIEPDGRGRANYSGFCKLNERRTLIMRQARKKT
jgi:hypothetical protein